MKPYCLCFSPIHSVIDSTLNVKKGPTLFTALSRPQAALGLSCSFPMSTVNKNINYLHNEKQMYCIYYFLYCLKNLQSSIY